VPAVVNPQTTYREAWTRSQKQIRKLIPLAEELKVIIAVEEVWNKFLLSPIEFPGTWMSFQSPWSRRNFDVGNVVLYGYPQDWIRNLGKRIAKVHLKDFKRLDDVSTVGSTWERVTSTGLRSARPSRTLATLVMSQPSSRPAMKPICERRPASRPVGSGNVGTPLAFRLENGDAEWRQGRLDIAG